MSAMRPWRSVVMRLRSLPTRRVSQTKNGSSASENAARRQSSSEHRDDRREHRRHVGDDRRRGGGDDVLHAADVVGDPRLHLARARAREERERQPLEVAVDRGAQVVHDALADDVRQPGLRDAEHAGGDRDRRSSRATSSVSSAVSPLRDRVVEHLAQQERRDHRRGRRETTMSAEHDAQPRAGRGGRGAAMRRRSRRRVVGVLGHQFSIATTLRSSTIYGGAPPSHAATSSNTRPRARPAPATRTARRRARGLAPRRARSCAPSTASTRARGERRLVVGLHEPAGPPSSTISAGPEAVDRDRRQPAGHRPRRAPSRTARARRRGRRVAGVEERRQLVVVVPAGEEDVAARRSPRRLGGVLALPLARVAADQHERRAAVDALAGAGERRGSSRPVRLTSVKRPTREEHRAVGQRRDSRPRCSATLPSSSPGRQPRGSSTRWRAPVRGAVDVDAARSASGSKPLGQHDAALRLDAEQRLDARRPGRREHEQPLAAAPPSGACARPTRRRAPSRRARPRRCARASAARCRAGGRRPARRARRAPPPRGSASGGAGAGRRRSAAPARSQRARPGVDVALVGVVVDARRRPRPRRRAVLVGRVHRRVAGVEVDGDDVEAGVEGRRRRGRRRRRAASTT